MSDAPFAPADAGPAQGPPGRGRASWSGLIQLGLLAVPVKAYPATALHGPKQILSHVNKFGGTDNGLFKHPRKHQVRQQTDILCKHAEHQPVDEMGDSVRFVPPRAEPLRQALGRFDRPATVLSEAPDAESTGAIARALGYSRA